MGQEIVSWLSEKILGDTKDKQLSVSQVKDKQCFHGRGYRFFQFQLTLGEGVIQRKDVSERTQTGRLVVSVT